MSLKITQIIIIVCMSIGKGVKGGLGSPGFWNLINVFLLVSSW